LVAKDLIDDQADRDLAALGLADAPRFSVPLPFNTLLWSVVAMTPDGYVIGDRSLVADTGPMPFTRYRSDTQTLAEARGIDAVERLMWFNHGFMQAQVIGRELVLTDLRLGREPDYIFSFVVAERNGATWRAIPPRELRSAFRAPIPAGGLRKALADLWTRIWQAPVSGEASAPAR